MRGRGVCACCCGREGEYLPLKGGDAWNGNAWIYTGLMDALGRVECVEYTLHAEQCGAGVSTALSFFPSPPTHFLFTTYRPMSYTLSSFVTPPHPHISYHILMPLFAIFPFTSYALSISPIPL